MNIYEKMTAELENRKGRGAWSKGVTVYALELVESLQESAAYNERDPRNAEECREWMLNGASDWKQYSWGSCSLCYNGQIARRLCNPSELKKTDNGNRKPNAREEWLDTQARALYQASERVCELFANLKEV